MKLHIAVLVSVCVCSMAQVNVGPAGKSPVRPGQTTRKTSTAPTTVEYEPPELEGTTTTAKPNTTTASLIVTTPPIPYVTSPAFLPTTTADPYFVQTDTRLNQGGAVLGNMGQSGVSNQQGWQKSSSNSRQNFIQSGPTTQPNMGQFGHEGTMGPMNQNPMNYNAQTNMIPDGFYSVTPTTPMSTKMSDIIQGKLKSSNSLQMSLVDPGSRRRDKFLDTQGQIPVVKQYVRPKNGNDAVSGSLSVGGNTPLSNLANPNSVLSQRIVNTRIPHDANFGGIVVSSLDKLKWEAKSDMMKRQQQTNRGNGNSGWMSIGSSDVGVQETSGRKNALRQPISSGNQSRKPLASGTGGWVSMNLDQKLTMATASGNVAGGQHLNNKWRKGMEQQQGYPSGVPVTSNRETQLIDQSTTSFIDQGAASMIDQGAASVIDQGAASVIDHGATSVIDHGATSVIDHGATSVIDHGATSVRDQGAELVIDHGAASVRDQGAASVIDQGGVPVIDQGAVSVVDKRGSSVINGGTVPAVYQSTVTPSSFVTTGSVLSTGFNTQTISTQEFIQGGVQKTGAIRGSNMARQRGITRGNTATDVHLANANIPTTTGLDGYSTGANMATGTLNTNTLRSTNTVSRGMRTKGGSSNVMKTGFGTRFNDILGKKGSKSIKVYYKGKLISSNAADNVFSFQSKSSVNSRRTQPNANYVNPEIVSPVPTQLTTSDYSMLGTQTPPPTRALDTLPVTQSVAPWWKLGLNQVTVTPPTLSPISTKIFFQLPSSGASQTPTTTASPWSTPNKNTLNTNSLEFKQGFKETLNRGRLNQGIKSQTGVKGQMTAFDRMIQRDPYLAFAIEFERLYKQLRQQQTTPSNPSYFDRQSLMSALLFA